MPRVNVPSQCVVCRVKRLGGLPVDDAPRQRAGRKGNTTACEGQSRGRRSDRSARRKSRQANTLLFRPPDATAGGVLWYGLCDMGDQQTKPDRQPLAGVCKSNKPNRAEETRRECTGTVRARVCRGRAGPARSDA